MTHTNTIEKAPGACDSKGLTTDTNSVNFRTDGAINQAPDGNAIATQLARLALAGQSLTQTADGYVLSRWTYSKYCADMDTVEHLLGRAEGFSAINLVATDAIDTTARDSKH